MGADGISVLHRNYRRDPSPRSKKLVRDIESYVAERSANPKPYKWKAEGAKILSKIKRARVALDKVEAA